MEPVKAASGETADRKNTGQSRIKPDHMQLADHHIQQSFDPERHLKKHTNQPSKTTAHPTLPYGQRGVQIDMD